MIQAGTTAPAHTLGERARELFGEPIVADAQPRGTASLNGVITAMVTSNDPRLLSEILDVGDFSLIEQCVVALPIETVAPFLDILMLKLKEDHPLNAAVLYWIQALLVHHMSYLTSLSADRLQPLHNVLERSSRTMKPLMRLDAKLALLLSNSAKRAEVDVSGLSLSMPVYREDEEDSSGSDDEDEDDIDEDDADMMDEDE